MICWSCERNGGDGAVCAACGAILPPAHGQNHFDVLGLPPRYAVDLVAAEERFRALSREVHPDRFAKADARARRASLQQSVRLNEAWRTIKDPVRRAEYLLFLAGYEIGAEQGASRPAVRQNGDAPSATEGQPARERLPVPPALLGEILELREDLADARASGDNTRVQEMAADMRLRIDAALNSISVSLREVEAGPASTEKAAAALERAARELMSIRYFRRFLDEVNVHEEAAAAAETGGIHA